MFNNANLEKFSRINHHFRVKIFVKSFKHLLTIYANTLFYWTFDKIIGQDTNTSKRHHIRNF